MRKAIVLFCLWTMASASAVVIDSGTIRASFNGQGELARLVTAKGGDLLEMRLARPEALWKIELCRPEDFSATTNVTALSARHVSLKESPDALRIVYEDAGPVKQVEVEVRADRTEGKLRWRLSAMRRITRM